MSVRIHVIAARGASAAEFQSALRAAGCEPGETCQAFGFGASGDWQWAFASVWGVAGSDIDVAIGKLAVPALRVTSSDGVLWMLALTGPGQDLFHGVHHFTHVQDLEGDDDPCEESESFEADEDFPADELTEVAGIHRFDPQLEFLWDQDEADRLARQYAAEQVEHHPVLEEYTDYGVELPEDVVATIRQQTESEALRTALLAHGRQIVETLRRLAIPFDRDEMLKLLTVGPLIGVEQDSEIGDMPRFLELLGIHGMFEDDDEEDDEDNEEDEDDDDDEDDVGEEDQDEPDEGAWGERRPPGPWTKKAKRLAASHPLTPLAGPLAIEVRDLVLLSLLAEFFSRGSEPLLLVLRASDPAYEPSGDWLDDLDLEIGRDESAWTLCFQPEDGMEIEERSEYDLHDLVQAVRSLPEGSRVEITFDLADRAGECHRYAGELREGKFHVEQNHPSLPSDQLSEVLDLLRQASETKAIELKSPQEEEEVRKHYRREFEETPRIRNGKVMPDYGARQTVVRTLLFNRYRDAVPWDVAGAERRLEADWAEYAKLASGELDLFVDEEGGVTEEAAGDAEMLAQLAEMMEQAEAATQVPRHDEVIYRGEAGTFYRASLSDLEHLSADSLAAVDAALGELGFSATADMVADIDPQELTRCYAGPAEAVALLGHRCEGNQFAWSHEGTSSTLLDLSGGIVEFHTHFTDGTTLVTNNSDGATSMPDRKVYVRTYEDFPLADIWRKHQEGIARFAQHRDTTPVDHTPCQTPEKFAALMDQLLQRLPIAQ